MVETETNYPRQELTARVNGRDGNTDPRQELNACGRSGRNANSSMRMHAVMSGMVALQKHWFC